MEATTLENSFAFLPPEIVSDVIDQIAGRRRFTADHLKLSQLEGTWGDFFRGHGSIFYETAAPYVERMVCNNGAVVSSIMCPDEVPEHVWIHSNSLFITGLDSFSKISPRLYGRQVNFYFEKITEKEITDDDVKKMKIALDGLRPRFEGIEIHKSEQYPQLYLDFFGRMLQSARFLIILQWSPQEWNLEDRVLRFCLSKRFEFFKSLGSTRYSYEFIAAVYEGLKARKCPFDLKPRWINVDITEDTARCLVEKFQMMPLRNLSYYDQQFDGLHLDYWKQEQSSAMSEMTVEIVLLRMHYRPRWRVVICLQKCNGKSLEEEYGRMTGNITTKDGMKFEDDEMPAEIPFAQRTVKGCDIGVHRPGWVGMDLSNIKR